MPEVTLAEAIFLDVLFIGHCKKMRLPGTETLKEEYKGIYKKALKDIGIGLAFGVIVYWVLFCINMVVLQVKVYETKQEIAVLEKELEELRSGSSNKDDSEYDLWEEPAESTYWDEQMRLQTNLPR